MIKLQEGEHIIIEIRKHWFVFFIRVLPLLLVALVPWILFNILESFDFRIVSSGSTFFFVFFLIILWLLILWIIAFIIWTNYYLDLFILTNKRLIEVEQIDLFERRISVLDLEKIQDVTSTVRGLIQTYFNYGILFVQSAGTEREFVLYDIKEPHTLRHLVNEAINKIKSAS